jgi:peptidoglycan/LPS O-acetylase OafA/YrhL
MGEFVAKSKRYGGIDGLRAYSIIAIVLMHVLSNGKYSLSGFIFQQLIPSFANFVFMFMVISGFAMCCGYYNKFVEKQITVEQFYTKRYVKIWPFFTLLCLIDFIISPSVHSLYETFANLTLCFGLLPDPHIAVIGVGWFLGLVFVFYILFPFFCFLLTNKRRALFSLAIMLILNVLCTVYFFNTDHVMSNFSARTSIVYCAVFFLTGGIAFLYKERLGRIADKYRWVLWLFCVAVTCAYYFLWDGVPVMLVMFSLLLILAMGEKKSKILSNPFTRFISDISFEIYLCHMVIYRIIEKTHMLHSFDSDLNSFVFSFITTFTGAVVFSLAAKWGLKKISLLTKRMKMSIIQIQTKELNHGK